MTVKKTIISVSDKENLPEFAQGLHKLGIEIVSTGGTSRFLEDHGIPVQKVEELTSYPHILDGRVKTLHPAIFGGILARRDNPGHVQELQKYGIAGIDMVVCNLYPFQETVAKPGITLEEALENIDIGGVTLLRAAAKNYPDVLVIVDRKDYTRVLDLLQQGEIPAVVRSEFALKAFRHTRDYDTAISEYLAGNA